MSNEKSIIFKATLHVKVIHLPAHLVEGHKRNEIL